MDPLLSGACRPLVEKTQAELAVTVTARLSPELPTGSQVLIQDMKQSGELVILLKPDRKDQQYLIALVASMPWPPEISRLRSEATAQGGSSLLQSLLSAGWNRPFRWRST